MFNLLDRHQRHVRPADGFADRFCIVVVVLLGLDVRFHVLRIDDPDLMAKSAKRACPMVGTAAGLLADQARWHSRHHVQQIATLDGLL